MAKYPTAPLPSTEMPKGVPYIVGNEAAERFSFYGMKAILFVFMTKYLITADGEPDVMGEHEANKNIHLFTMAVYFFPFLGAILSDAFLGKYRTIISLSIVYCLGHLALALDDTRRGLLIGLSLIAIGAGGIKPCVSAHVGDQFGTRNQHLVSKVFSWFYFAINVGAFTSMLITPLLLEYVAAKVAFALPGVLMFLATLVFWMGRRKFVHIPPGGMDSAAELLSGPGLRTLLNVVVIFLFVVPFWSLFDQQSSAWVAQAERMDRQWMGIEWLSSQIQAFNPILILIFIPLFSYVVYPIVGRVFPLTPLRKISIGLFLAASPFVICALVQTRIEAGQTPNIGWQLLAYVLMTAAEVMVSITCLEFAYTQAPRRVKSFIMSLFLLSMSAGNLLTAGVNDYIQRHGPGSVLDGANYYWFFVALMLAAAVGFVFVAQLYRGRTYIQGEEDADVVPSGEGMDRSQTSDAAG